MRISDIAEETRIAAASVGDYARDLWTPTLRLGVTGLSRSGKTVFITALVHNLLHGGRLPLFDVAAEGRLVRAYLQPQPDYELPRFDYERHLASLTGDDRAWPESTRRISQLRVTLEFEPTGFFGQRLKRGVLNIDIVDYPGEWLLDLPMLEKTYEEWSADIIEAARRPVRAELSATWLKRLRRIDPHDISNEIAVRALAEQFTNYLSACRESDRALSVLPPGRFLMPGDLEGSPLLTFSPLIMEPGVSAPKASLQAMMASRYEAYRRHVVQPFYRNHFARLDRQIVLVDVLSTLNAGSESVEDLRAALTEILHSFRPGGNSWLSSILGKRIDRIVFAATKADLLHQTSHDALEAITARLVRDAIERAEFKGSDVDVVALAAIRATREATVRRGREDLPCIVGVPEAGQFMGRKIYDGEEEAVLFPGDLPDEPDKVLEDAESPAKSSFRFLRLRPPQPVPTAVPAPPKPLPHIRLDATLNFLLGDRLA